ncbi:Met-10+ like-protein [Dictyocaulus viviparus]|uniref:Met-10+ like-protein n=1 Tax=Dictyocaulus viviparus TaxID=29172 RepID=A0A0D8Y848_DICVI|nr:Met-10+ like-protein [Dictyocaulus viviparus]
MMDLNKDLFVSNIALTAMKVDASKVSIIQRKVRIEKYLIRNLGRVKCIMDADEPNYKLFLFNPNVDISWEARVIPIFFEDWDLRRIFRAILPDDLEFRTVVNKIDGITSEYRNFKLDLLAGADDYVTELTENGVKYRLDFSKVFWNSRLSHEHERVVSLFSANSLVYDVCAGIGPFVLPALKKGRTLRVLANDLNPESVRWLQENAILNKIPSGKMEVYNLDAVEFISEIISSDLSKELSIAATAEVRPSEANILINLPAHAVNFLPFFKGLLSNRVAFNLSMAFPVKVYCYLFAKAHEEVPHDWYEKKACEMIRKFLSAEDAFIKYTHHVCLLFCYDDFIVVKIK